jgi:rRNA maturation RNase YbeY
VGRINFYFKDVQRFVIFQKSVKGFIAEIIKIENGRTGEISVIFCKDDYLLEINKSFLNHDFFTDIVTFDNSVENEIAGELYISIDRVKENSVAYNQKFKVELVRVVFHGILHLLGYHDHTPAEKSVMRGKEDEYLTMFHIESLY